MTLPEAMAAWASLRRCTRATSVPNNLCNRKNPVFGDPESFAEESKQQNTSIDNLLHHLHDLNVNFQSAPLNRGMNTFPRLRRISIEFPRFVW
jgi:hypothetical protein